MTLADRKTVETDAHALAINTPFGDHVVPIDFARRLERERDAAVEALTLICNTYGEWVGAPGPSLTDTVESARAVLAEIEGKS